MSLTHETLRPVLAKIFFGADAETYLPYLIPKQGNWLNPQDIETVSTYIAYTIRTDMSLLSPRTESFTEDEAQGTNYITTQKAVIDLQFIGVKAEEYAKSLMHWDFRIDVEEAFDELDAVLIMDKRTVVAVPYWQDGGNSILSFNVSFRLLWHNTLRVEEVKLSFVSMHGEVDASGV